MFGQRSVSVCGGDSIPGGNIFFILFVWICLCCSGSGIVVVSTWRFSEETLREEKNPPHPLHHFRFFPAFPAWRRRLCPTVTEYWCSDLRQEVSTDFPLLSASTLTPHLSLSSDTVFMDPLSAVRLLLDWDLCEKMYVGFFFHHFRFEAVTFPVHTTFFVGQHVIIDDITAICNSLN